MVQYVGCRGRILKIDILCCILWTKINKSLNVTETKKKYGRVAALENIAFMFSIHENTIITPNKATLL